MISVAIIDDHPLYRQGLAMAVEQADDFTLMADAPSVEDFDRLDVTVNVVMLDLHLPGIGGAEGVAHICARGPKVIVVSAAGAADDVIDAVAAGAAGYLTKDAEAEDIRRAVRAVANGQMYVSPTLASYLIKANEPRAGPLEHQLSPVSWRFWHWLRPARRTATLASNSSSRPRQCIRISSASGTRPALDAARS